MARVFYLWLLAVSLRKLLAADLAGAELAAQLSDEDYEILVKFVLSDPRIAARYHSPNVSKAAWLHELNEATESLE